VFWHTAVPGESPDLGSRRAQMVDEQSGNRRDLTRVFAADASDDGVTAAGIFRRTEDLVKDRTGFLRFAGV
jgi:hypothetical protein